MRRSDTTFAPSDSLVLQRLAIVADYLKIGPDAAGDGLIWKDSQGTLHFLPTGNGLEVGRACGLPERPDDQTISRSHFRVSKDELEDLDSSNGTFVNDREHKKIVLMHGDVITAGRQVFVFHGED